MDSRLRNTAIAISIGRVALGAGLLAVPEKIARGWIGPVATERSVEVLSRAVGIRDVAMGAGGAAALIGGHSSAAGWLFAAAAVDVGDIVATLLARDVLPANGVAGTAGLAGVAAVVCTAAAAKS